MRLRLPRPRRLSVWLFLALGLMLAPQFIGAAVGISQQQAQISDAREDGRAVAMRLGRIAHLQATLDATEDAVLREPGEGRRAAGPRVRGTLARANADVLVLDDPALSRDFDELQALAAGPLDARSSLRRLEAPLDALRTETAQLADKTVARTEAAASRSRADQRDQLLNVLLAFGATLTAHAADRPPRSSVSIRRPLRSCAARRVQLGSGDLAHRASSTRSLSSTRSPTPQRDGRRAAAERPRAEPPRVPRPAHRPRQPRAAVRPHRRTRSSAAAARRSACCSSSTSTTSRPSTNASATAAATRLLVEVARRLRGVLRPPTRSRASAATSSRSCSRTSRSPRRHGVAERILLALASPVGHGRRGRAGAPASASRLGRPARRRRRTRPRRRPRDVRREVRRARAATARSSPRCCPAPSSAWRSSATSSDAVVRDELERPLPARRRHRDRPRARRRGARALDAPRARPGLPDVVHPARRAERA